MRRFTQLYFEIDQSNRTLEKLAALQSYFAEAPARDAAWALYFLSGRRILRVVNGTLLRTWASEDSGIPLWLLYESLDAVVDRAETLALLLPPTSHGTDMPFHQLVKERMVPLRDL